jgi:ATP-dependent helicase HrpB
VTEPRSLAPLPVDEALPRLADALRRRGNAVLRAPAGAGKTTRVPPALLDAGLAGAGQVVVLEPRRVAARAAARRIAEERGVRVGDDVGYVVRFDRKAGPRTRIVVVTDGVLLRRLQDDPFLESVGAVVFDEFHERSLAADLALAMCRRVQRDARPDLRIVAMSATIDAGPVAGFLDAEVVESAGFLHPVDVRHLERPDARRAPDQVAGAVRAALAATTGDVLAFLPGVGEIRSTGSLLADLARTGVDVVELFGDLPPERQDAALAKGARRRVVLATNVAETSVTVEGVTAVVDSGLARVMRHDPAAGMDRLVLERIAKPSIVQRTGRAGRVAPGVSFRLWTKNEERAFPDELPPEVRRVDIAGAVLELLAWGEKDVAAFPWFEAPEPARLAAALDLLARLGAVRGGRLTDTGEAMARLPLHPRLARIVVEGHRLGHPDAAALAAALLAERDPIRAERGRRSARHQSESDVLDRMDALVRWDRGGSRSSDVGELHVASADFVLRARDDLVRTAKDALGPALSGEVDADEAALRSVFAGFPDRLAKRRAPGDRRAVLVTGRGVRLADESAVADAELFVAVNVDAGAGGDALVRMASAVDRAWLPAERVTTTVDVTFDEAAERVAAVRRTRFDELVLDEAPAALPDDGGVERILAEAASSRLDRALDLASDEVAQLRVRVAFLRAAMPDLGLPLLDDDAVRAALPDLCAGRRSFEELRRAPLADVLRARLERRHLAALDREAPERIPVPSGSHVTLRYEEGRAPVLAVRIQEIFGWRDTPRVAGGRIKVLLHLLAPNHRPQQVTDDLASFWTNTYPDVRKELKRRYPKHAWPEDPWTARAERKPQRRR